MPTSICSFSFLIYSTSPCLFLSGQFSETFPPLYPRALGPLPLPFQLLTVNIHQSADVGAPHFVVDLTRHRLREEGVINICLVTALMGIFNQEPPFGPPRERGNSDVRSKLGTVSTTLRDSGLPSNSATTTPVSRACPFITDMALPNPSPFTCSPGSQGWLWPGM